MKHISRATLLIVLFVSSSACAKEKTLSVVICAGQSNMQGRHSKVAELSTKLQRPQKRNLFFSDQAWVPIAPGITESKGGFGPEISFAFRLGEKLNKPVGIIKLSVGGTDLAKQWSPQNKNSLYAKLLKKIKAAQRSRKIKIIGMIWMQGEKDSRNKNFAQAYAANLKGFITQARKDFSAPKMIFISGRVNPPKPKFAYSAFVRKGQESVALSRVGFIDCDLLEKRDDNLHYTTKGIEDMGNNFADTMFKMLKRTR